MGCGDNRVKSKNRLLKRYIIFGQDMARNQQNGGNDPKEKVCARCGTDFLCLHNQDCWCMDYDLTAETLAFLRKNYDDCLCPACLSRHGLPKDDPARGHSRN